MSSPLDPEQQQVFDRHFKEANVLAEPLVMLHGRKRRFILNKRQRANKAIKQYKACLDLVPDHWPTMWLLAKLYQAMGEPKVAFRLFQRVMELEGSNPDVAREASISAMNTGEVELALDYSKEAVRRNPMDAGLVCNHAVHLMVAGRDAEAGEWIVRAEGLAPEDVMVQRAKEVIAAVAAGEQDRPRHDELG